MTEPRPTWVTPALLAAVVEMGCGGPPAPQPGQLWYAGPALCGFAPDQLNASGQTRPSVAVATAGFAAFSDVAFDNQGNAWVVGSGSDDVLRLPAGRLDGPGTAAPDLVLRSSALSGPGNLVFDADGSLWVANRNSPAGGAGSDGTIVRFDVPAGSSGMLAADPVAQLSSDTPGDLYEIGSITFDGDENLWVTSFAGIIRFDQPRSASGQVTTTPGAVIDKTGYPDDSYFYSVGFHPNGTLIAASSDGLHHLTRLTAFANPALLSGRSSPAPLFTIPGEEDLLPAGGLAFEPNGDLWMATGVSILLYANPASSYGTVDVPPALTLSVTGAYAPTTNTHLLLEAMAR